jgi:L-asparaginase
MNPDRSGRILVFTTGGTISSAHDAALGGFKTADNGLKGLINNHSQATIIRLANVPSTAVTLSMLSNWAERINKELHSPDVVGAVVTTGTNGLEEIAFYLDLTIRSTKPVAITGSMYTSDSAIFDGKTNVASALQVVLSGAVDHIGVVVVMNDQIHAARYVQKIDANKIHAFESPMSGPIGYLVPYSGGKMVRLLATPVPLELIPRKKERNARVNGTRREPKVWIASSYLGAGPEMIETAVAHNADAIVIEGFPSGEVTPGMSSGILKAISEGIPVVATCRAPGGELTDLYAGIGEGTWLRDVGVIFAAGLTASQARICTHIAIQHGYDLAGTLTQSDN